MLVIECYNNSHKAYALIKNHRNTNKWTPNNQLIHRKIRMNWSQIKLALLKIKLLVLYQNKII